MEKDQLSDLLNLEGKDDETSKVYIGSGLSCLHGATYQLKLLMLFLLRAIHKSYSFYLATEIEAADKFDDVIFQFWENGEKAHIFVQAKHKQDEENRIKIDDLLKRRGNAEYYLPKYFISYLKIKHNFNFTRSVLKDFILCTNIELDLDPSTAGDEVKRIGVHSLASNQITEMLVVSMEGNDDFFRDCGTRYRFFYDNNNTISGLKVLFLKALERETNELKKEIRRLQGIPEPHIVEKLNQIRQWLGEFEQLTSDNIEEEIKAFFDSLVLAVGQPNETKLSQIIKSELNQEFNHFNSNYVYARFLEVMLDWLKDRRGYFLTQDDGSKFFDKLRVEVHGHFLFNVQSPVASFFGREEELKTLHNLINQGGPTVIHQPTSICGLGGIGKTELVRKYVSEYGKQFYDDNILWIDAQSYESMKASFIDLASYVLGVVCKDLNIKSVLRDTYSFFSKRKCLFVFDNAVAFKTVDSNAGISDFLPTSFSPQGINNPKVLITSRNREWGNIPQLELKTFKEQEAFDFIKFELGIEDGLQDAYINKLAEILQYFPLALQQAVAYIKENNRSINVGSECSIIDYISRYESETKNLLNFNFPKHRSLYVDTTYTIMKITITRIKENKEFGEQGSQIIYIISLLAPENIPVEMFLELDLIQNNKEKLGQTIELLKQYSLINSSQVITQLNVHRLVQQVARIILKRQEKEGNTFREAIALLIQMFKKANDLHNYCLIRQLLTHSESLLSHLDSWLKSHPKNEATVNSYFSKLYPFLSKGYQDLSNFTQQMVIQKRQLALLQTQHGNHNITVTVPSFYLSISQGALGHPQKKKELLERVLKIEEKHYGRNHFKLAKTLMSLGNAYGSLGNTRKEKDLLEQALKIQERHYGRDNIQVASTLVNLSNAHCDLGDVQKHKELIERALKIQENHYGKNHFKIANTLVNLANAYFVLGSPQKQKEILEQALIIQENHYGKNHFEVAITLGSLGNANGALGDPRKQIKFYKQALDIQEKHYGKNNFEITNALVNLANAYGVVGDPKNQKELLERALSIQEQHYGEHNFRIVATLVGLGNAYGALGDPKKQKESFERALEIEEKQYGRFNINVAKILCCLSNAYCDLGDPQTQKLLLERALDIQEKHYGRNHFEVGNILINLGNAYLLLGHPQKQIELLERALIILEKHYGRNYYKVGITLHNLGIAYGNLGQPREQKEYLERALEIEEKHYGRNNFKLAKTLIGLGNAYGSLGNTRKQKDLLEQALKIQERHYGRNHIEVASTLVNLSNAYCDLGDTDKRLEFLKRALKIQNEHYGNAFK